MSSHRPSSPTDQLWAHRAELVCLDTTVGCVFIQRVCGSSNHVHECVCSILRCEAGPAYAKAVMFVDNAGPDVVLGMLPFARELLKQGTKVSGLLVRAVSHMPLYAQVSGSFSCPAERQVTLPHQTHCKPLQMVYACPVPCCACFITSSQASGPCKPMA